MNPNWIVHQLNFNAELHLKLYTQWNFLFSLCYYYLYYIKLLLILLVHNLLSQSYSGIEHTYRDDLLIKPFTKSNS